MANIFPEFQYAITIGLVKIVKNNYMFCDADTEQIVLLFALHLFITNCFITNLITTSVDFSRISKWGVVFCN